MPTLVFSHPDIFLHDAEADHVAMSQTRIATIAAAVLNVDAVVPVRPREATIEQLARNHTPEFLHSLQSNAPTAAGESYEIDGETIMNRHTWRALQLSAGAVCDAIDAVQAGQATNAFCIGYAGHHAAPAKAGGFCFINPVAIGARHALATGTCRLAILDIDTHSGNGTILSMWDEPRVFFGETYQPGYPSNFMPGPCPKHMLRGRCQSPQQFRRAWTAIFEAVRAFNPDLIMVSAGFDAHRADPLGCMGLTDEDYRWLAQQMLNITPKVVATLEGGYAVPVTARCAAAFVEELTWATTPRI